ncbi:hypothetical protein NEMBOFW57_006058 [Staphylotrichum longicolle]|uniref:Syntaxin N-terminal domain-containing protein n=1 Tax=Staphylotrichum longicolle TaxID=669026 RepID=A0AAD4HZ35_9PEZI|nr:hypothetical protein NEMBOFW57_006058 [Staphylotrichum longicolle]
MSYNPYTQAPSAESGYGYGQPQSYGSPQQQYGQQYGQEQQYGSPHPQQEQYGSPRPQGGNVLSQTDFLQRVSAIRADIQGLTTSIQNIATLHQQTLASSDNAARQALDDQVAATQLKNTSIRSQIQQLKADTERTTDGSFGLKKRQFDSLNADFKDTIQRFIQEEQQYKERYREQIARQYRIVNPDATDEQVRQAADADWGDEGIFQQPYVPFLFHFLPSLTTTQLRTNRPAKPRPSSAPCPAKDQDRASILELLDLLEILNQQITTEHLGDANVQIEKGVQSARRARKLKWWCLGVCILICIVIALGVGLGVALTNRNNGSNNNSGS